MKKSDDIVGIVSVYKNGEHICTGKNLITNVGRAWMTQRSVINNGYYAAMPIYALVFGSGTTESALTTTSLASDLRQGGDTNVVFTPKDNLSRKFQSGTDAFTIQPAGTHETFSFFTNTSLNNSATSITVQHPHLFPDASTADSNSHFFLKITDASGNNPGSEVVKVTNVSAHTVTTGTLDSQSYRTAVFTIVRGQKGTNARAFSGPSGVNERNTVELYEQARCTHVFQGTHDGTTGSHTVKEAGLFAKKVTGMQQVETDMLVSRIVFDTQFDFSENDSFDIVWDLKFT